MITGRAADPSLFVGPLVHSFGWPLDAWPDLGRGTLVGHLLECAGQVTGGYFADPGRKDVEGLERLGFPIAEVPEHGPVVITKVDGSGGVVTAATCKEQLLYEIHDPSAYVTPDTVADFSRVTVTEVGRDRVAVDGATGRARPETLKVSLGYRDGYIGEGQISYAGSGAVSRARLAAAVARERLERSGISRRRRQVRSDRRQRPARRSDLGCGDGAVRSARARGRPRTVAGGRPANRRRGRDAVHERSGRRRRRDAVGPRGRCDRVDLHPACARAVHRAGSRSRDEALADRARPQRRQGHDLEHLPDRVPFRATTLVWRDTSPPRASASDSPTSSQARSADTSCRRSER